MSRKIKIGINGYGRIGRNVHRNVLKSDDMEVVAINSRANAESHAHLLRFDSLYGQVSYDIYAKGGGMMVNGQRVAVYQEADHGDMDWAKDDVDLVIESTGKFTSHEDAKKHLAAGAKKVVITAPCKDETVPNVVMGVNSKEYKPDQFDVISNASCTTNALAPLLYILDKEFGIESAFASTIHAFTHRQNLHDNSHEDFRRARATTESIIPTSTGAMKAIHRILPGLEGKIDGGAFRVPVPVVSCIDMNASLRKNVTPEQVNEVFKKYEEGELKGYLGTCDRPLVSVDFRGDTRSSVIDTLSTRVLMDTHVKLLSWYDNEWAYANRVLDLIRWFV